mgnify:CR=1 FL=1
MALMPPGMPAPPIANAQGGFPPPPATTVPLETVSPEPIPGLSDASPSLLVDLIQEKYSDDDYDDMDMMDDDMDGSEDEQGGFTDTDLVSEAGHIFAIAAERNPALLKTLEFMARTIRKNLLEPPMDSVALISVGEEPTEDYGVDGINEEEEIGMDEKAIVGRSQNDEVDELLRNSPVDALMSMFG